MSQDDAKAVVEYFCTFHMESHGWEGGMTKLKSYTHQAYIRDFSWLVLIDQFMPVREEGSAQSTLWYAVNGSFLTWLHREEAGPRRYMASKSTS